MVALIDWLGVEAGFGVVATLLAAIWLADLASFPRFRFAGVPSHRDADRRAAWRILASEPVLARLCVFALLSAGFYISLDEIVAPAFFVERGFAGEAVALFLVTTGVSGMAAAGCYTLWGQLLPLRSLVVFAQGLVAAGLLVLVLLPVELSRWIAAVAIGFGAGSFWPTMISQVLRRVRRKESGRAVGALSAGIMLAQPAAAVLAGPGVDLLGPDSVLMLFAGLLLLPLALLSGRAWR
jgi:predicted MFS family arabinose efflux permease